MNSNISVDDKLIILLSMIHNSEDMIGIAVIGMVKSSHKYLFNIFTYS